MDNKQIIRVFQNSMEAKGRASITVFSLDSGFIAVDNETNKRHSISNTGIADAFEALFTDVKREIEKKLSSLKPDDAMDIGVQVVVRATDDSQSGDSFEVNTPLDLSQIIDAINAHYRRQASMYGKGSLLTPATEQGVFQALKDAGAIKVMVKEKTGNSFKQGDVSKDKIEHPGQSSFNAKKEFDQDPNKNKNTFKA